MALTKTLVEDKIEVVGDFKAIQIRTAAVIKEDGTELSRSFNRKTLGCGDIDESNNWVDSDISAESAEVKAIAAAVWTQSVKDAYKAHLIAGKS
jgi:hypothetical protein